MSVLGRVVGCDRKIVLFFLEVCLVVIRSVVGCVRKYDGL